MPHIIVKLWPGKTEEQKKELAAKMVQVMNETFGTAEKSISVAFEEIPRENWVKEVYQPDIEGQESKLYKKPGYKASDV